MIEKSGDARTEEMRHRLAVVKQRIAVAQQHREVDEAATVELIVVTKFFPADDVRRLLHLGVTHMGENRDQEAALKAREVPEATWHFIGQLQTNKTNSVVRYATSVHSVDRDSLVTALGKSVRHHRGAVESGQHQPGPSAERDLECLIQVSLDGLVGRGGALPQDVERIASAVVAEEGLRLRGVMAVAPLNMEPNMAFKRLYECAQVVRSIHPNADQISAGMSGDLEAAIRWGSTHVRVGSGILGARPVG